MTLKDKFIQINGQLSNCDNGSELSVYLIEIYQKLEKTTALANNLARS